jgi:hypothetical protein
MVLVDLRSRSPLTRGGQRHDSTARLSERETDRGEGGGGGSWACCASARWSWCSTTRSWPATCAPDGLRDLRSGTEGELDNARDHDDGVRIGREPRRHLCLELLAPRCFVRCPVPAVSSAAPSASWPIARRVRRVVEVAAIDGPPCRRDRQPVHWPACQVVVTSASRRYGLARAEVPLGDDPSSSSSCSATLRDSPRSCAVGRPSRCCLAVPRPSAEHERSSAAAAPITGPGSCGPRTARAQRGGAPGT